MALIKNHKTTEENRSARRRNGRQSQGAATAEGKERSRTANLKHGYYSQIRDEALVALGEDPVALAALVAGAYEQFEPTNPMQAAMAEHLAHLHWRMLRAERLQESSMVRHIKHVDDERRNNVLAARDVYANIQGFLNILNAAVGRPDFHAAPQLLAECESVMKHDSGSGMQAIRALLFRLRRPQRFSDPLPPPMPDALDDNDWQNMLESPGAADASVPAQPVIEIAEGEERDELRVELRELIEAEVCLNEEIWEKKLAEREAPLAQIERDRLAVDVQRNTALMRRDESSCCREFWRTATLLMKFQAGKGQGKSEVKQESEVRSPMPDARMPASQTIVESNSSNLASVILPPDSCLLSPPEENAGASGDIHENKGRGKTKSAVARRVRGVQAPPKTGETAAAAPEFDRGLPVTMEEAAATLPDPA